MPATKRKRYRGKKGRGKAPASKYVTHSQLSKALSTNVENYRYSRGWYQQSVDSTGTVTDLTALIMPFTGASGNNQDRKGLSARLKSLSIVGHFYNADAYNDFRLVLLIWKPSNLGSTITWNHIVEDPATAITSPYNEEQRKSVRILFDRRYRTIDTTKPITDVNIHLYGSRLSNIASMFHSDTSNAGENHLYLAVVSDSSAVSHPLFGNHLTAKWVD